MMLVIDGIICFTWMGISPFILEKHVIQMKVSSFCGILIHFYSFIYYYYSFTQDIVQEPTLTKEFIESVGIISAKSKAGSTCLFSGLPMNLTL